MPHNSETNADGQQETAARLLVFTENVDCPSCGEMFLGTFTDDSMDVEDMAEPPSSSQECPGCGHRWVALATGWFNYGDAG